MARVHDVAIVGYGPAGVVAAGLLGGAGLDVYVCERMDDVHQIPRAIALDHEIVRVFQQLGVLPAIKPYLEPFTPSEYFGVDGQLIRRMTMLEPPYPQAHTPSSVFTQPPVERALRARVAEMPTVTVELRAEMRDVSQDDTGVTLQVAMADGAVQPVRAKYLIACDGGASPVRTQLAIPLEDLEFDEPWLVVDVLVNDQGLAKLPQVSVQYCDPDRPCTLVIGPKNHRRWEISLKPGEDPNRMATPEETWRLLSRWITPEDGTLWRQASYRFHALVASRWRKARVFLAGDAAHMQPPFLGQGMCQGVRDATNLCWKLAAVLRGEVEGAAGQALLDSYGVERKAHVRELTSRIKGVGAVICERDVEKARARDARMLAECGGVVKDTPRQDILPPLTSGLRLESPGAGTLFPQPRMADGARMDDRFGCGWRLVVDGTVHLDAVAGLTLIDLAREPEAEGVVGAWMARHGVHVALIRPDHYTFGSAADAAGAEVLMAAWDSSLKA